MSSILKNISLVVVVVAATFLVAAIVIPHTTEAQQSEYSPLVPCPDGQTDDCLPGYQAIEGLGNAEVSEDGSIDTGNTFTDFINIIYRYLIAAAAVAAVIMIIVGGVKFILARDKPGARNSAKKTVVDALIGLLIIVGAVAILNTINPDLANFNLTLERPEDPRHATETTEEPDPSGVEVTYINWVGNGHKRSKLRYNVTYEEGKQITAIRTVRISPTGLWARECKEIGKTTARAYYECDLESEGNKTGLQEYTFTFVDTFGETKPDYVVTRKFFTGQALLVFSNNPTVEGVHLRGGGGNRQGSISEIQNPQYLTSVGDNWYIPWSAALGAIWGIVDIKDSRYMLIGPFKGHNACKQHLWNVILRDEKTYSGFYDRYDELLGTFPFLHQCTRFVDSGSFNRSFARCQNTVRAMWEQDFYFWGFASVKSEGSWTYDDKKGFWVKQLANSPQCGQTNFTEHDQNMPRHVRQRINRELN